MKEWPTLCSCSTIIEQEHKSLHCRSSSFSISSNCFTLDSSDFCSRSSSLSLRVAQHLALLSCYFFLLRWHNMVKYVHITSYPEIQICIHQPQRNVHAQKIWIHHPQWKFQVQNFRCDYRVGADSLVRPEVLGSGTVKEEVSYVFLRPTEVTTTRVISPTGVCHLC